MYVACRPLLVNGRQVQRGDHVPEAEAWRGLEARVGARWVRYVEDNDPDAPPRKTLAPAMPRREPEPAAVTATPPPPARPTAPMRRPNRKGGRR